MEEASKIEHQMAVALRDFDILLQKGNLGFYNSCAVTEIFLHDRKDNVTSNVFIRVAFQEKAVTEKQKFLTKKLHDFDGDLKIGALTYELSVDEAYKRFNKIVSDRIWLGPEGTELKVNLGKVLPKQYIGWNEEIRLNKLLVPSGSGSHIVEFFDHSKEIFQSIFQLPNTEKFNKVCVMLKDLTGIDLSIAFDRLGNIIFQFPVDILKYKVNPVKTSTGFSIDFKWHSKLSNIPECNIHIYSKIEDGYMGAALIDYNGEANQVIEIGNLDNNPKALIYRKSPNLLIGMYENCCSRPLGVEVGIENGARVFASDGELIQIDIFKFESGNKNGRDYLDFINSNLYSIERENLEKELKFKQYFNGTREQALKDLRRLTNMNNKYGVYLWDPFLTPNDLFDTIYFSSRYDIPLKAIGSINDSTKLINGGSHKSSDQIITDYKTVLEDPKYKNIGLNLEFRLQHSGYGYGFHDRFLIFPGGIDKQAKAYSLGTSVNSIGKSHHIVQEVAHPQRVIDAFNDLWGKLQAKECLVWKHP
ncbi:VPA1262 family N-terminal domain-containing protein [Chitinophaga arvensicola]|uniref:Uncharacterized protein n=1 Tax=Chitinophaga arvensicola TaxID=29529 RepID=A0A1I0SDQ7_9BACT|nr:VPA1262 family N-terminal domain-containing protein [Chitinophaga arvensicola]SEW56473.1 hypothetical protein SAMN04488122_6675 [Chitinophaga arvensicola]